MKLHKDSHLDHGLSAAQLAHVLLTFEGRDAFFIETITLPDALGTVPCALFGPVMGDPPVPSARVEMKARKGRAYPSRMLVASQLGRTSRRSTMLTVIAGPHDGAPCVLFTVFGGPLAPKEPDDPTLKDEERSASIAFWAEHALADLG